MCQNENYRFAPIKNITIQLDVASGGPAGGQTFEKFDKQILQQPLFSP